MTRLVTFALCAALAFSFGGCGVQIENATVPLLTIGPETTLPAETTLRTDTAKPEETTAPVETNILIETSAPIASLLPEVTTPLVVPTIPTQQEMEATNDPEVQRDIVTDAYTYIPENASWCCYHIPQVNLPGNLADEVNAKIYRELYDELYDLVLCYAEYDHCQYMIDQMAYSWVVKDSILSVIVRERYVSNDINAYYIYNISLDTGKEISKEELLDSFGLDEDTFYTTVEMVMHQYWDDQKNRFPEIDDPMLFQFEIEQTLAYENVKETLPYINENGGLSIMAIIYAPAGALYYYRLFDVDANIEVDGFVCDKSSHYMKGV